MFAPSTHTYSGRLPAKRSGIDPRRRAFLITAYIDMKTCRRAGRNWVTQGPSCKAAGRDRGKDNLAISVEEPLKYLCWAGCTREQIRAALGAPLPALSKR